MTTDPWVTRGTPHRITACAGVVLAPNPGPMTLDGTNTWLLSAPGTGHPQHAAHPAGRGTWPGSGVVVVDPGPDHEGHLRAVAETGRVTLILITHRHADHSAGIDRLHELTGAPVRAVLPEHCRDAEPLRDGETIVAAGVRIEVLATPGHTADSVSFRLPRDEPGTVITGDTVLGRGTTMIDHPDGTLAGYLRSLERLSEFAGATVLPAHAGTLPDLRAACEELAAHRRQRLGQVRDVLDRLGPGASIEAVTDAVYPDVPEGVRRAARHSVAAQLAYLND